MIAELAQVWHWPPAAFDDLSLSEIMGYFARAVAQSERNKSRNG